jgi:hypothetical protein
MGNAVVDAIIAATPNNPNLRAAMLMGSSLESNQNASAVGDNGKSFGPFQIYTVAHPNVSPAQAADPVWATNFMLPSYQAGVAKVPSTLWTANPALAAATAAFYAERPKVMYTGYAAKWATVQAEMSGQTTGPQTGGSGGTVPDGSNATQADLLGLNSAATQITASFTRGIMTFANMGLFAAATAFGALIFLIGLVLLFRETSVGGAAGKVASAIGVVNPVNVVRKVANNG